jgi:hypothetical protein
VGGADGRSAWLVEQLKELAKVEIPFWLAQTLALK